MERIRSGVLVLPTQLFKILEEGREPFGGPGRSKTWLKLIEVFERSTPWRDQCLIATSVVEEGVDVQACSFVLVFDTLKT
jgi:hypothetical protein